MARSRCDRRAVSGRCFPLLRVQAPTAWRSTARTATYFPAKAGGYAFCARCDVDRDWCSKQPACVKQTEIFMLHHAAFEQRDPRVLTSIHADMHAALMATLQMCIQEVLGLGVLIKAPKVELAMADGRILTSQVQDKLKRVQAITGLDFPRFTKSMLLAQGGFAGLRQDWQQHHLWQDQPVELIHADGLRITGIARGVDSLGALLLETPDGVQRFHSGDVSLRSRA